MLVVKADVEVAPNPNEISEIKWVELELLDQIMDGEVSDDMVIAPWFRAIHDLYIMDNYDEKLDHSDVISENCMVGDLRMDPRNT